VTLVRTDILEERIESIIRVTRISEVRTTLVITINQRTLKRNGIAVTLMMEAICSSETSALTRATRRNRPENGILQLKYSSLGHLKKETVQLQVPTTLPPEKIVPGTHCIGGWAVPEPFWIL
jgi:hypothetical protein